MSLLRTARLAAAAQTRCAALSRASRSSRAITSSASPAAVEHFLLEYKYDAPDEATLVERRAAVRGLHLSHARSAKAKGVLVYGGAAFAEPPSTPAVAGVIVFKGCSRADVVAFARADPYVNVPLESTGKPLVSSYVVRRWAVVI